MSASCTVMSGFAPGVTLRNSFIAAWSPNSTVEFDCSPENSAAVTSGSRSCPGMRWKVSPVAGSVQAPPSAGAASTKVRSQAAIASRSCRAS